MIKQINRFHEPGKKLIRKQKTSEFKIEINEKSEKSEKSLYSSYYYNRIEGKKFWFENSSTRISKLSKTKSNKENEKNGKSR